MLLLWTIRVFWGLLAAGLGILAVRIAVGGAGLSDVQVVHEYAYEQTVTINAAPGDYRLSIYVPMSDGRTQISEEHLNAAETALSVDQDARGRLVLVQGPKLAEPRTVSYQATLTILPVAYDLDESLDWDDVNGTETSGLESTDLIQTGSPEVLELLGKLFPEQPGKPPKPSREDGPGAWQDYLKSLGISPVEAVRRMYVYCRDSIRPASYSGTTDALTALRLEEASCGGKSRLLTALCRTVGIHSRIVGGVILGDATKKRTSHVWMECSIAGTWIPFDPLNDHYASVPGSYLTLYHGDAPVIRYTRGLAFDYGFSSRLEAIPAAWQVRATPGQGIDPRLDGNSLNKVPLLQRSHFSIILLAPFALLFVVFARQVLGFDSIGLFLPVLLGFTISQIGWIVGGSQILAALLLGAFLRLALARLNLLYVPRIAFMITFVVMALLVFSAVLSRFEGVRSGGSLVIPLAALAMTIERFTVAVMDRGNREAMALLFQTLVLAVGCYFVLTVAFFKAMTVAFPEILLLVLALIVMVGHYRGLRLRERWRFRQILPGEPVR